MHHVARERREFVQLTPAIRRRLEATIESLIALVDAIDGDPDAELTACENDIDYGQASQAFWSRGSRIADDAEDDDPAEADPAEASQQPMTPSVGFPV